MEEDSKLNYPAALKWYSKGLEEFLQIILNEPNTKRKAELRERADVYLQRAEELKTFCSQSNTAETTIPIASSSQQKQTSQNTKEDKDTQTAPAAFTYAKLRKI